MTIQRHRHTGLTGDGEKIDYNNLINKPATSWGAKALNFTRASSVGTWSQSFTWFGFHSYFGTNSCLVWLKFFMRRKL